MAPSPVSGSISRPPAAAKCASIPPTNSSSFGTRHSYTTSSSPEHQREGEAPLSDDREWHCRSERSHAEGRIGAVKTKRDIAQVAHDHRVDELQPDARITENKIAAAVDVMRANVLEGTIPFRRASMRAMIDNVEAPGTEIRIHGRRSGS